MSAETEVGMEQTTEVTSEPLVTTPEPKTAAPEPKGIDKLKADAAKPGATAATNPAHPAYTPNFKFKVLDKEHEFDDFLRGAVKDADTEKKVRDLYERAYGLESVKTDRQSLKNELAQAKERIQKTDQTLGTLGEYIQKNDYDSFFSAFNIPKEAILRYALDIVQREQWPPEQKAAWEASRQAQQQATYYQQQNQELAQRQQQLLVHQREFELSTLLSRPEVTTVAQAYEAGMGTPGAFRDYVIQVGQAYAARGQDISAEQAVAEATKHLRAVMGNGGVNTANPAGSQGANVVAPNQKPVIPNVQGRGTSAVRSTYKSIDDLKRRARELEAQEA